MCGVTARHQAIAVMDDCCVVHAWRDEWHGRPRCGCARWRWQMYGVSAATCLCPRCDVGNGGQERLQDAVSATTRGLVAWATGSSWRGLLARGRAPGGLPLPRLTRHLACVSAFSPRTSPPLSRSVSRTSLSHSVTSSPKVTIGQSKLPPAAITTQGAAITTLLVHPPPWRLPSVIRAYRWLRLCMAIFGAGRHYAAALVEARNVLDAR